MTLSLEDFAAQAEHLEHIMEAGESTVTLTLILHQLIEHIHENTHTVLSPIQTLSQMGLQDVAEQIMAEFAKETDMAQQMSNQLEVMLPLLSAIHHRLRAITAKESSND